MLALAEMLILALILLVVSICSFVDKKTKEVPPAVQISIERPREEPKREPESSPALAVREYRPGDIEQLIREGRDISMGGAISSSFVIRPEAGVKGEIPFLAIRDLQVLAPGGKFEIDSIATAGSFEIDGMTTSELSVEGVISGSNIVIQKVVSDTITLTNLKARGCLILKDFKTKRLNLRGFEVGTLDLSGLKAGFDGVQVIECDANMSERIARSAPGIPLILVF